MCILPGGSPVDFFGGLVFLNKEGEIQEKDAFLDINPVVLNIVDSLQGYLALKCLLLDGIRTGPIKSCSCE